MSAKQAPLPTRQVPQTTIKRSLPVKPNTAKAEGHTRVQPAKSECPRAILTLNAGFYPAAAAAALYHYSAAAASGGAAASLSASLSSLISSNVWCGQISDRAQLTANTHTQSWLARLSAHVLQHHQQQQQSRSRRCLISNSSSVPLLGSENCTATDTADAGGSSLFMHQQ